MSVFWRRIARWLFGRLLDDWSGRWATGVDQSTIRRCSRCSCCRGVADEICLYLGFPDALLESVNGEAAGPSFELSDPFLPRGGVGLVLRACESRYLEQTAVTQLFDKVDYDRV